jgi:hypothetical protein
MSFADFASLVAMMLLARLRFFLALIVLAFVAAFLMERDAVALVGRAAQPNSN